jgi:hypothetical protein
MRASSRTNALPGIGTHWKSSTVEKVGLRMLGKAWPNTDVPWAASFVTAGAHSSRRDTR